MWFVWDGKTRQGPYTEGEICRRLSMGEWTLFALVCSEESRIYRPLVWMLSIWHNSKNKQIHATEVRSPLIAQFDETQWAAIQDHNDEPKRSGPQRQFKSEIAFDPSPGFDSASTVEIVKTFKPESTFEPKKKIDEELTAVSRDLSLRKVEENEPKRLQDNFFESDSANTSNLSKSSDIGNDYERDFLQDFLQDVMEEKVQKIKAELKLDPPMPLAQPKRELQFNQENVENLSHPKRKSAIAIGSAPEFPADLETKVKKEKDIEPSPRSAGIGKKNRTGNQKPAIVSEGSVSLAAQDTETQIRLRRVNPTAPRKLSKSSASQPRLLLIFDKKWWKSLDTLSLAAIVSSLFASILILLSLIFMVNSRDSAKVSSKFFEIVDSNEEESSKLKSNEDFKVEGGRFKKKKNKKIKEISPQSENTNFNSVSQDKINSFDEKLFEQKIEKEMARLEKKKNSSKKKMAARQASIRQKQSQVLAQNGVKNPERGQQIGAMSALSSAKQIDDYLASTAPSARKFVMIGPLSVVERPTANCGPCLGKGVLPDGSVVKLSSVVFHPWKSLGQARTLFARGLVVRTNVYLVMINALTENSN